MPFSKITVLLADPNLPDHSKPGGQFTEDDFYQVTRLREALATLDERRFDFIDDHSRLYERLREERPCFVLNFCDTGYGNNARRELHIPALLELLDIPFSGSGPVALGLCYDKSLVRALADARGVPVPAEAFVDTDDKVPVFDYPAFVKPNCGDGSVGITEAAIVNDAAAATARIAELRTELAGTAMLLQEFLSGTEYGLGLIGNTAGGLTALPMLEVDYSALPEHLPRLLNYASKVDPQSPYWTDIQFQAATLDTGVQDKVRGWCERLYDRLQLRDYARFDFRADAHGRLKLMEVNPNPAWCWDGKLARMGQQAGLTHGETLELIITAAEKRYAVV